MRRISSLSAMLTATFALAMLAIGCDPATPSDVEEAIAEDRLEATPGDDTQATKDIEEARGDIADDLEKLGDDIEQYTDELERQSG